MTETGTTRLPLTDRPAAPPAGFQQICHSLAWHAFAAAAPATVARGQIGLLVRQVEAWQRESRHRPDRGGENWTNIRRVKVRTLDGEEWIWEADCENLVQKLIGILIEAGIPPGALRLVAGEMVEGDPTSGHLVLAIETEDKTLVYDCRVRGLIEWVLVSRFYNRIATDRGRWLEVAAD